jgi:pyruvate kinase
MAARGDLYVENDRPDEIIDACEEIIAADPTAVMASRVFESLKDLDNLPKCQDITDVYCGMKMGYKVFMVGDDVCTNEGSVRSAIGLFEVISQKY